MTETSDEQKPVVYLSGFGKFGTVLKNPTTELAEYFAKHSPDFLAESVVLETSTVGSTETLLPIWEKSRKKKVLFLHLGVSASSKKFHLESRAYNLAHFPIPDERGYVADNDVINADCPDVTYLDSGLKCTQLCEQLSDCCDQKVAVSDDAGRYICNYVYFKSLDWLRAGHCADGSQALFLHVPPFEIIPFEDQIEFVGNLMKQAVQML